VFCSKGEPDISLPLPRDSKLNDDLSASSSLISSHGTPRNEAEKKKCFVRRKTKVGISRSFFAINDDDDDKTMLNPLSCESNGGKKKTPERQSVGSV